MLKHACNYSGSCHLYIFHGEANDEYDVDDKYYNYIDGMEKMVKMMLTVLQR